MRKLEREQQLGQAAINLDSSSRLMDLNTDAAHAAAARAARNARFVLAALKDK